MDATELKKVINVPEKGHLIYVRTTDTNDSTTSELTRSRHCTIEHELVVQTIRCTNNDRAVNKDNELRQPEGQKYRK
jgi:hypothetical protein